MGQVIWQVATVVDASPGRLQLALDPLSTCSRCLRGEGCGAGVFARLFRQRRTVISLERRHEFQVGQKLRVGMDGSVLLYGAMILYGLPIAAFVLGALSGHGLGGGGPFGDLAALVGGLVLAGLALLFVRRRPLHGLNPRLELLSCTSSECNA